MDTKTSISERIQALIDRFCNGKNSQFAKTIGVAESNIRSYLSGTQPKFDVLSNIAIKFAINCEWLLTGKGDMLNSPDISSITKDGRSTAPAHHVPEGSHEGIPLIPLSAMAGVFTGSDDGVMEFECERYVIPAFKGADFLIQVKGDSMQPTYYSGDLVACQRVPLDDLFFQWNKTYVLDTKQGPLIKRIMPGSDSSHVLIVSDNDSYPPFELSKSQFHGVALVRGLVRLE